MAERLRDAVSPYLRVHADNPVDWYPWGEDAFRAAVERDVPVLISIGYATCHWCHVMARESFSDPAIAEALSDGFVAIKVDREEHPDVDGTYLAAASAFTRQLGWPLTVFADPQGRAFFAGTYFPPRAVQGVPAFRDVLVAVSEAWRERRGELEATASAVSSALAEASVPGPASVLPDHRALEAAARQLAAEEDPRYGGFGGAPKFPVAPVLSFLAGMGGEPKALARRTLLRMGASPLRDPVDGGFFRYATRADWSEPHYERMLSDNALLLTVSAELLADEQRDGGADAARLATLTRELVRFLSQTMRLGAGGFASAQDSESTIDGVRNEGGYYALDSAGRAGLAPPPLDEKVLTGWNGLAIAALARAGEVLGDVAAIELAASAADWLLEHHVRPDGTLVRASRDGVASSATASLEDTGMLAGGLLRVAIATGEVRYAVAARRLVDLAMAAGDEAAPFVAPEGADPVLTARGLALPADPAEGATPSGITATADAARLLHALGAGDRYLGAAEQAMSRVAAAALARPIAFGGTLRLLGQLDAPLVQVVTVIADDARSEPTVAGEPSVADLVSETGQHEPSVADLVSETGQHEASVADLVSETGQHEVSVADLVSETGQHEASVADLVSETRQHEASVAIVVTDAQAAAFADAGFEFFEGRRSGGAALAYRCERFVCALPVTDAEALRRQAA